MTLQAPDFTLAAGPVSTSARTLRAFSAPVLYHYDPVFLETFERTQEKVARLFRTTNDVLLMQGEAILGLEGAARSLVRPGMPVLNLVQGVFGKGMGAWLASFGAELHEIEVGYDEAVDPDAVERYLSDHPEIELLAAVHSETPSGTVTDMSRIGPIAKRHGVLTLVDAVSSVGGLEFEVDAWGLDLCVTGAQKCIGGPAGIALVAVSEAAWRAIEANDAAPRASYLSLLDWREKWLEQRIFPYTPTISDVYALEAACDELLEEGLDAAIARHAAAARVARAGARAMGLDLWARSESAMADCVTSIRLPDDIDHVDVRTHARERYGVMLSSGQGAGNLIRIAHMGPTASGLYPLVSLAAIGQTLRDLGMQVDLGAGLEAATAELSRQRADAFA
jgi:pyridoxamine---pyruvate transaminase